MGVEADDYYRPPALKRAAWYSLHRMGSGNAAQKKYLYLAEFRQIDERKIRHYSGGSELYGILRGKASQTKLLRRQDPSVPADQSAPEGRSPVFPFDYDTAHGGNQPQFQAHKDLFMGTGQDLPARI
jgi:hypothetical protein